LKNKVIHRLINVSVTIKGPERRKALARWTPRQQIKFTLLQAAQFHWSGWGYPANVGTKNMRFSEIFGIGFSR
jgi:hypothetical protein